MRILIAVLFVLVPLAAQEPGRADRLVRAGDVIVAGCDGPAKLRLRFLPTNLGTMLAAKEAEDFRGVLLDALRGAVDEVGDADHRPSAEHMDACIAAFTAYGGRMRLGIAAGESGDGSPQADGVLVLAPEQDGDLGPLSAALTAALGDLGGGRREAKVADLGVTILDVGRGTKAGITLPVAIDGQLAVFFGDDVEASIARRLDAKGAAAFVPDDDFAAASCAVEVDVPALYAALGSKGDDGRLILEACGVKSVRAFRMSIRPRGPHVQIEGSVSFVHGVDRALLGGLMPAIESPPALIGLVPANARQWYAGKLRCGPIYHAIVAATAQFSGTEGGYDAMRARITKSLGFDVEDDLIANVGEDTLAVGVLPDAEAAENGDKGASYFVIRLSDPQKFAKRWDELFHSEDFSMHFDVERRGELEVKVGFFGGFAWAIDGDVLVLAAGSDPSADVFEFLEQRRAVLAKGGDPTTMPESIHRVLRAAPAGMQGAGSFDVDQLLAQPLWEMLGVEGVTDPVRDATKRFIDGVRPLLEQYGLARPVAFAGWHDDRFTYRVLW